MLGLLTVIAVAAAPAQALVFFPTSTLYSENFDSGTAGDGLKADFGYTSSLGFTDVFVQQIPDFGNSLGMDGSTATGPATGLNGVFDHTFANTSSGLVRYKVSVSDFSPTNNFVGIRKAGGSDLGMFNYVGNKVRLGNFSTAILFTGTTVFDPNEKLDIEVIHDLDNDMLEASFTQGSTMETTGGFINAGGVTQAGTFRMFMDTRVNFGRQGFDMDNIVVETGVIPEPATLALLGLGSLLMLRRRRA